jgi:NADH-quinone oxidoreductase subunit N
MAAAGVSVPDAARPLATLLYDGDVLVLAVSVSAILSMTVGNLAALRQQEVRRLLAWSSIAHAGYLLLALAVWSRTAAAALVTYLLAYLAMNLAAFFLAGVVIRERGSGDLAAFRGLSRASPFLAVAFAVVLFSLVGLPPFFGFVGKVTVFYAVFGKGYAWLGVVALLNGALSLYYYAKVVASMFLAPPDDAGAPAPLALSAADRALALVLVLPLVLFGVFWSPVWDLAWSVVPAVFPGR